MIVPMVSDRKNHLVLKNLNLGICYANPKILSYKYIFTSNEVAMLCTKMGQGGFNYNVENNFERIILPCNVFIVPN